MQLYGEEQIAAITINCVSNMKPICILCVFLVTIIAFSCTPNTSLKTISLPEVNTSEIFTGKSTEAYKATIFIFLSPECPLSEAYTKNLKDLAQAYKDSSVQFITVFSGRFYSAENIQTFIQQFDVPGTCVLDEKKLLANSLKATVTPEVFLLIPSYEIMYSGAIDNWVVDLGTKRQTISEHYLEDALAAVLQNEIPTRRNTKAVGCFIE